MNRPFRIILAAETISMVGSQVTLVALPLTAVLLLHATSFDMGLLRGVGAIPSVVFGLFAGVLIERWPKRRVLLVANAVSAMVLALVPIGADAKMLSLGLLMGVSFVGSGIGVGEGIALTALVPAVVPAEKLAAANGRLGAAMALSFLAGPALAGVLIAAFSAPGAIAVDAASFAVALGLLALLPSVPVPVIDHAAEGSVWARLRAGFGFIRADPVMRPLMLVALALNFFGSLFGALEALFIVGHLGVKPAWFGGAVAAGGIGLIGGAMASETIGKRLDAMAMLTAAMVFFVVSLGGISALHGRPLWVAVGFGVFNAIGGFGGGAVNVTMQTYVQRVTPAAILARVSGVIVSSFSATVPLGALLGGSMGAVIGLRPTLMLATAGFGVVLVAMLVRVAIRPVGVVGDDG